MKKNNMRTKQIQAILNRNNLLWDEEDFGVLYEFEDKTKTQVIFGRESLTIEIDNDGVLCVHNTERDKFEYYLEAAVINDDGSSAIDCIWLKELALQGEVIDADLLNQLLDELVEVAESYSHETEI